MKTLLHCCCGPCAIYPIKVLSAHGSEITCFFHNPNIHPYKEFSRRLSTFREYVHNKGLDSIIDDNYGLVEFTRKTVFNETSRCSICYSMRLTKTAQYGAKHNFDSFTTTLLYSRYQQHDMIISLCENLASEYGIKFLYEDFRVGWQEGIDSSITSGMYRQPYCGCIYSEQERYDKGLRKQKNNNSPASLERKRKG